MNPPHSHGRSQAEKVIDRTPSGRLRLEGNVVHIDRAPDRLTPPPSAPRTSRPSWPALATPLAMPSPFVTQINAPTHSPPSDQSHSTSAETTADPVKLHIDLPNWLRRISIDPMKLNKLVVSSYKVVGFAILGTILFGLASFIFINLFYMCNRSWVTPMIVSSTDPRVMQLNAQYEAERVARDGVAIQRLQLQFQREDAERVKQGEDEFQAAFRDMMRAEALDRGAQLAMLHRLIGELRKTRTEMTATSKAFTAIRKEDLKGEYAARLIDKDQATRGGYELSQIASANLALSERDVEANSRMAGLQRAVDALKSGKRSTSYEILRMQHEYEQSVLASKRAEGTAEALAASVALLDKTVERYDAQIARVEKAPYLQALDKGLPTAFVPYDNVGAVKVGDAVYACAASVFWCKSIGRVAELLDGEVVEKHPLHSRELRGVLVKLELTEPKAMEHAVLYMHRAPMLL